MTAEELQIRVTIQCSREDQPQRVDANLRVPAEAGSGEEKVHGGRPIARVVGGRYGSARQSRWTCAPISVAQAGRSPSGRSSTDSGWSRPLGLFAPCDTDLDVDSDPIHVGQTIVGEPLGRIAIRHEVKQEGAEAGVRYHRRRPGQL